MRVISGDGMFEVLFGSRKRKRHLPYGKWRDHLDGL
jgi:hypothetical protein